MPENASFQGLFAEVGFDTSVGNQLLCFQNNYFFKIVWSYYETHNQVKFSWKIKLFFELFTSKFFEITFVFFE